MSTTETTPAPHITEDYVTREADPRVILDQIGVRALMTCGARMKRIVRLADGGIRFEVSRGRRYLTIVLAGNDTYTIERTRITRRDGVPVVVSEAFREEVYCEDLARTVIELGDV